MSEAARVKDTSVALAVGDNLYVYGNEEATARVQDMLRRLALAESRIYAYPRPVAR